MRIGAIRDARRRQAGWTMVEMGVVLAIITIMAAAGLPQLSGLLANGRVRAAAQSLQDGIAVAQAEALRRSSTVEFVVTNGDSALATATAASPGTSWSARLPADATRAQNAAVVRSAPGDPGSVAAQIENRASNNSTGGIAFSPNGRVMAINGGAYSMPQGNTVFRITATNSDRPLCVYVTIGGSVKSCDPKLASSDSRSCTATTTTPIDCPAG